MKLLGFTFLMLLAGCASAPVATNPSSLFKATVINNSSSAATIDTAFYQTLADCQNVLYGLEQQSTSLKWWGAGLQIAGAVAGSILLPMAAAAGTASKVTIAALGGFAGFTNTAVDTVRQEGLGAADVIRTRANVQANMQVALTKFYAVRATVPIDQAKAAAAVDELKVACISYWLASPTAPAIVSP